MYNNGRANTGVSPEQRQPDPHNRPPVHTPTSARSMAAAGMADYTNRLAPSYQAGPDPPGVGGGVWAPPGQGGFQQAPMFAPLGPPMGYDAEGMGRDARYGYPGGQPQGMNGYLPRLDMGYMNMGGVWDENQTSPQRRDGERGPLSGVTDPGSRPPTSGANGGPPGYPGGVQVKEEPPTNGQPVVAQPQQPEDGEIKPDHRKRKRNRTIRSCVPCHNHKRKCDRKRPCGRCTALGLTGSCVYEVDEARDPNDPDVIETDRLRRRIAELEQVVRELRQRHPPRTSAAQQAAQQQAQQQQQQQQQQAQAQAQANDADKRRVLVDRYARFKSGEVAGGAVVPTAPSLHSMSELSPTASSASGRRDHYTEPYMAHALPGEELVSDPAGRKTWLGTPAGKPMFRRLREIVHGKKIDGTLPEDAAFTGWFASTRKTYPFTTIWSHDNFIDEIVGLLPSAEEAELLYQSFIEEIGCMFQAWHEGNLLAEYRAFFALSAADKKTQPLSHLSLFIMICALGSMVRASSNEIMGEGNEGSPTSTSQRSDKGDLTSSRLQSELYLSAAYQALRLCSFQSSPTIATVQSQFLVCVYLLHSERAADSWGLTGSLVRQCIAMGLHVDPTHLDPKVSQKEAEIKRRIWWSVAGLDALLCVSFGRPTMINYYTCALPQDVSEESLSEEAGSAVQAMIPPPSNALGPETTDETFHAALFQLTLPSVELLNRVFHVSPLVARNAFMGWFTPSTFEEPTVPPTVVGNSYEDAIRLGRDIFDWYDHLPEGIKFDPSKDLDQLQGRSGIRINQTLALCVKTFILVLILHRPYLRADPSAYPESSSLCARSAHIILQAYHAMARSKSTIAWSWWTMSYRAFHAGTVCAFLAIREPGTALAERCLADLRSAIAIFEDRTQNWNILHPVQSDLCTGLVRLEKLATAAAATSPGLGVVSQQGAHASANGTGGAGNGLGTPQLQDQPIFPGLSLDPHSVPAFPSAMNAEDHERQHMAEGSTGSANSPPGLLRRESGPFLQPWALPEKQVNCPYGHTESLALPQIWASMFNIKMDEPGVNDGMGAPQMQSQPSAVSAHPH